ncbi:hypothetical protein BDV11DRAFT_208107 [Aspergillus similis]
MTIKRRKDRLPGALVEESSKPCFDTGPNDCPAFFEHVMLDPHEVVPGQVYHQPSPTTFDLLPDWEFEFSDVGMFGADFIPDLELAVHDGFLLPTQQNIANSEQEYLDSTKRRVDAFQNSFWNLLQESSRNALSDDSRPIGGRDVDNTVLSPHSIPSDLTVHEKLSSRSRDEILRLIVKTGDHDLSIPELPSFEHLDILIKVGLAKKLEVNPWIHLYTCYDDRPRPEFLTALVASGCVSCLTSSVNKTGLILQEIVRVALRKISEASSEDLRDFQYLQASMIWLEIGFSCGYRRNMRMTEGGIQALAITLRRIGAFDSSSYKPINPCGISDENIHDLDRIWKAWIKQESLKRLVYQFFCHDVEVAAAMNQPPTSFAEFTLPIPSSRDLWLAPTAQAWKATWMAKYQQTAPDMSLRDLVSNPTLFHHVPGHLDARVAAAALLHGLIAKVWDIMQQKLLGRRGASKIPAQKRLLLQSRQEDLYTDIQQVQSALHGSPPETTLMAGFATMYLHIDIDALQRFVGKLGEGEAKTIYPYLRDWSTTQDARIAIWHAGQVFRAVRHVGPYKLRGFDSFAIYYASLTLYVYGLLLCADQAASGPTGPWSAGNPSTILLDGPSNQAIEAFIMHGCGSPGLSYSIGSGADVQQTFCGLHQPRLVMRVALQVLDSNFAKFSSGNPEKNPIPPLVANLRGLLQDLANLP